MNKKIKDERIELSKLKVYKEVMFVLLTVLLISLFEQIFIYNKGIESYIRELVFFLLIIVYIFLRNLWLGNFIGVSETINKRVIVLSTIVSSIASTLIFSVNNYMTYISKYTGLTDWHFLGTVLIFFIQMVIIFSVVFYLIGKQEAKKNKMFEE